MDENRRHLADVPLFNSCEIMIKSNYYTFIKCNDYSLLQK